MLRRVLRCWILGGSLWAIPAHADPALVSALDAALAARALHGAEVAALVVTRDAGSVLYAHAPDRAMVPASNQKILTAVASLATFGPTHVFPLEVSAAQAPDGQGEVGSLYLRGGGNPALTSEDFWRLGADLRLAGVKSARAGLVIDETAFDAERRHPNWGAVSARSYHAPVGAFTVNYGSFAVKIEAGAAAGDPVQARIDPPVAYFELVNRAVTGAARSALTLDVSRSAGAGRERVLVTGNLPVGGASKAYNRSVIDPVGYAAAVLRMQLAANGIAVGDATRLGAAPETAWPLPALDGPPLSEILRLCLKFSNNAIAESLVKALGAHASGAPGSWSNGVPALRAALLSLGVAADGLVVVDGSGLSYDDRVTPRQLVAALRAGAAAFGFGPEFIAALPIAARDGTLAKRAEAAADGVRAKTGLLTRTAALSGFAKRADGSEVVFSLLVNGFRSSDERAIAAVDGFVAALVGAKPARVAQAGTVRNGARPGWNTP